ncbi:hypothetical protein [Alcanivorax sp.]|uniref:hypothetical protein n=1 Tax=Alcanivorax sp. TaxID=1872427 RepID=UPI003A939471
MATLTDIAARVMKRLGLLDPDENPQAGEAKDVITIMESAHASLLDRGLIDWPFRGAGTGAINDPSAIPMRCQQAWINYAAWQCSADFGATSQEVASRGQEGYRELIALSQQPHDSRDIPVTDY